MLQIIKPASEDRPRLAVLTRDDGFAALVRDALGEGGQFDVTVHGAPIETCADIDLSGFSVLLVDLEESGEADFDALQATLARSGGLTCVVVLHSIDEAMARALLQARISDVLVKPLDPQRLAAVCGDALRRQSGQQDGDAEIVTFLPATGGVGCSTLAIHSALLLQQEHRRERAATCLVDLNFEQGVCAEYLDLEPRLDLAEINPRPERLDRQLLEVMLSRHRSGLSVVAAPGRPGERVQVEPQTVVRLLDLVSANFDHVVIDLPRHWSAATDGVVLGSNRLFLVAEMTVPALRQARRLATVISERLADGPTPRIIVNRYEQRAFGAGLGRADIEHALGSHFAGTVSNNYRLVRDAIDQGVPISQIKPNSAVIDDLARLILPQRENKRLRMPFLEKLLTR